VGSRRRGALAAASGQATTSATATQCRRFQTVVALGRDFVGRDFGRRRAVECLRCQQIAALGRALDQGFYLEQGESRGPGRMVRTPSWSHQNWAGHGFRRRWRRPGQPLGQRRCPRLGTFQRWRRRRWPVAAEDVGQAVAGNQDQRRAAAGAKEGEGASGGGRGTGRFVQRVGEGRLTASPKGVASGPARFRRSGERRIDGGSPDRPRLMARSFRAARFRQRELVQ
jgi:hypothetical protein